MIDTITAHSSPTEPVFYDTATVAETRRRLLAEGHHVSENALRGWVRQGILPAAHIGRKVLLYYPNVLQILKNGTLEQGVPLVRDRPAHIPTRIAV